MPLIRSTLVLRVSRALPFQRNFSQALHCVRNTISRCSDRCFSLSRTLHPVTAIPLEGASINGSYTLMLADFSAIGNPDAEGEYRHYLANGVQISSVVSVFPRRLPGERATKLTRTSSKFLPMLTSGGVNREC